MSRDEDHLQVLSVFYYIMGGMGCLFALIPLLYVAIGVGLVCFPEGLQDGNGEAPPAAIGWLFGAMGLVFFLVGQAFAICTILAGRFIASRKHYMFTFVIGCIKCMSFPLGTALGVFTILVLSRDSVKKLYGRC
jgi:hypothetical protein